MDDDLSFLELTRAFLRRLAGNKFIVKSLENPELLHETLKENQFDVIVSDFQLMTSELNGLDLLEEIRKDPWYQNIPFILLTGRGREEIAISALRLGASGYVKKEGNPETMFQELIHTVETTVHHHRMERELQRRNLELEILNRIISISHLQKDLDTLLADALAVTIELFDFMGGGIYLSEWKQRRARMRHWYGLSEEFVKQMAKIDVDQPPYDSVFLKGESFVTEDYQAMFPELPYQNIRSMACIPLMDKISPLDTQQNVIGAVFIVSETRFPEHFSHLLSTIGREVGSSLSHALLSMQLKETLDRYQTLIEKAHDAIFIENAQEEIVEVNQRACDLFGYDRDQLLSMKTSDLQKGISSESEMNPLPIYKNPGVSTPEAIEIPAVHKDGTPLTLELTIVALEAPEPLFMSIVRDISDRKRMGIALQAANRRLNYINKFARLNYLDQLSAISGYVAVLESEMEKDDEITSYLKKIRFISERLRNQTRAAQAIMTQTEELGLKEPTWQDLEESVFIAAFVCNLGKIKLNVNVEEVKVLGDPLFHRVFTYLMDNSIKHGSHVTEIRVTSDIDKSNVFPTLKIVYTDNGVGISKSEKERIFDIGFGQGTGYGLFVVKEILEVTGMSICERGVPEKGVQFEITVDSNHYRLKS
ncbi:MAG: PAS domain S-box protein [Candidatus Thorarchaeota archaeon]